jgi:hypothetical protein
MKIFIADDRADLRSALCKTLLKLNYLALSMPYEWSLIHCKPVRGVMRPDVLFITDRSTKNKELNYIPDIRSLRPDLFIGVINQSGEYTQLRAAKDEVNLIIQPQGVSEIPILVEDIALLLEKSKGEPILNAKT